MQQNLNSKLGNHYQKIISKNKGSKVLDKLLKFCFVSSLGLTSFLTADVTVPARTVPPKYEMQKITSIPQVWLSGDLLLLKAQENGLKFADRPQHISSTTDYGVASKISPHFDWNPGVRIDIGYQPRDRYYYGTWTSIKNTAHGEKNTKGDTGFYPEMSLNKNLLANDYVTSGLFHWKSNTNLYDLGTMFVWNPTPFLVVKNRVGVRLAALDQKFDVTYGGGVYSEGIDHVKMNNDFFGGGLYVGLSPNIILPRGFTIVGDIAASSLVGGFHVKQNEYFLDKSVFHDSDSFTRIRWMLDAKAAINWQKRLDYKLMVFSVEAGVEWHEFFKQNQLHNLPFHAGSRNIILSGGFISLCLGF